MNELQEDKKLSNPTVKWSDGWTTCLVTVELPRQVSKVTVTCDPLARRFSTIYRSFSGKPDTTVKLRLEQLHPNTETGYRFILKDGDEVLGWFKKKKKLAVAKPTGSKAPPRPPRPRPTHPGPLDRSRRRWNLRLHGKAREKNVAATLQHKERTRRVRRE